METGDGKPVLEFSGNTACGADACAYDVKLDLTTPTAPVVLKNTTVGRAGYGYAFGSVTLDAAGNAYLPYSRTDAANTPSAAVAATNAAGTVLFDSVITADAAGSSACGSGDTAPAPSAGATTSAAARIRPTPRRSGSSPPTRPATAASRGPPRSLR
ncbi:hypothetical protein ACFQ9X_27045 [Catenulispora yoronensis]